MEYTSILYNSTFCRLCAEENENGCFLYSCDPNDPKLSEQVNTYLPIKIKDDGHMPQSICPGCNIQLEATMEFIKLIIKGQVILREIIQKEAELKKEVKNVNKCMINLPDTVKVTSHGVYQPEHLMSLQVAGIDKPKRKRGRPAKKPKEENEEFVQKLPPQVQEIPKVEEVSGKRRRKTPTRFKEAVQGKELERIFIQEGVIDVEESESEMKVKSEPGPKVPKAPEIIGRSEVSGELVIVVKGKGRGRPKGRLKISKDKCVICGMEFSCVGRYMSHVAQHGQVRFQCQSCAEVIDTRLEFDNHQTNTGHKGLQVLHIQKTKKAPLQDSKPTSSLLQVEPESVLKSEEIPSQDIKTNIATNDTLQVNMKEINNTDGQDNLELKCNKEDLTDDTIQNKAIVENNVESGSNNLVEPLVDAKVDDFIIPHADEETDTKEVVEQKGGPKKRLECNLCDKTFGSKQSKSIHMKATHRGERPYVCQECGASFPYPRSLSLHALTHRRTNHSKGFACDLCGKVLNHPSSVVYHKEAEHGGQLYACGKCGKTFKHKQLLHRHQLVHSQLRPFTCKTCNATFKTNANLVNHQSLHTGIKKFSCEICKLRFAHKTSLTLHMRWHSGLKPYQCPACNKGFTQKGNLSEHMRIHTGERPFQCAECSKSFTTSSQYKLHMRRHSNDRPFTCAQCGKKFISRSSWRAHMRREAGARRHRCECGRAFTERCALVKHRRAHTGERPFRCPHCARHFADCSNRNKHVKQVHKHLLQKKSLLAPSTEELVPPQHDVTELSTVTDAELEERVIFVTYDIHNEDSTLHIMEPETDGETHKMMTLYSSPSRSPSPPPLYLQPYADPHHVTDEEGNPLHFTMHDGTQLAITSFDGHSLQVVTEDGHTIPVEINGIMNEEEVQSSDTGHQFNLQKVLEDDSSTQYFTIIQ